MNLRELGTILAFAVTATACGRGVSDKGYAGAGDDDSNETDETSGAPNTTLNESNASESADSARDSSGKNRSESEESGGAEEGSGHLSIGTESTALGGSSNATGSASTKDASATSDDASAYGGVPLEPTVAHCTPGTEVDVYTPTSRGELAVACTASEKLELPNATNGWVDSVALPEPMLAGQPYALSFEERGTTNRSIEIWGTGSECGAAAEVLWWGYLGVGTHCAEFVPTANYSHILIVDRLHDDQNSISAVSTFTFCGQGACPQGQNGHPLEGEALIPDVGPYEVYSETLYKGLSFVIQPRGSMKLVFEAQLQEAETQFTTHGYFRMPPTDPFGDAWYCVGDGSRLTKNAGHYDFHFENITKLGDCFDPSGDGSASVEIGESFSATVISSFSLLNIENPTGTQYCRDSFCVFKLSDPPNVSWIDFITSVDVGTTNNPTLEPTSLLRAAWFTQPDDDSPFQMSCATSGSLDFNPNAVTMLSLTGMSDFVSCPGTPVEPNEYSGSLK